MNKSETPLEGYRRIRLEILQSIQDAVKNHMAEENLSLSEMATVLDTSASRLSWLLNLRRPYGWSLGWLVDIAYHLKLTVQLVPREFQGIPDGGCYAQ